MCGDPGGLPILGLDWGGRAFRRLFHTKTALTDFGMILLKDCQFRCFITVYFGP